MTESIKRQGLTSTEIEVIFWNHHYPPGTRVSLPVGPDHRGVLETVRTQTDGEAYVDHEGIPVVKLLDGPEPVLIHVLTVLDD